MKFALNCNAQYVIITHNHIIGSCKPSKEDIELTRLCASYLNAVGIYLIDHIIITEDDYFSFAVNKLTDFTSSEYSAN